MQAIMMVHLYIPIKGMLYVLDLLSVEERMRCNVCVLVLKMKNGLGPEYLSNIIIMVGESHEYNTRNREKLEIGRTRTITAKKS